LNLCVNARDAMPDGGRLTIATRNAGRSADGSMAGPFVRLVVSDTGTGMAPEVVERVFEPFFTTKAGGEGTGLGLATVYGIVRQHEGHIHVESKPGKGTRFSIDFAAATATADTDPVPKTEPEPPGGTETVLVAEDDAAVRELVCELLTEAGYEVIAAEDGPRAVERFEARSDEIDLALLDVVMPGFGGQEVLSRIGTAHPDLRVLFVSGYSDDAVRGRLDPSRPLLRKPYDRGTLLRRIREILDTPIS
jgi:CheY-like chemotaxis protein